MDNHSKTKKLKITFPFSVNCFLLTVFCCFLLTVFCYLLPARAYVATSTNYRIQYDSINVGGGDSQTSTNYRVADTVGEIATGISASSLYKLKAGYRQMSEISISISSPVDVAMSPAIGGISGGASSASTTWTVITDNPAGFVLSLKSTSTPSMILDGTYDFSDYSPATVGVPDYTWSSPAASAAEFGYSVEPATFADTATLFKDDGAACNAGALNTADKCWLNASTTDVAVINRTTSTSGGGEAEKIKFQAQSNAKFLKEGNYSATIIVTAIAN
ncbi:hypothetical protein KKA09_01560 [Patescibacteria group bacterium]|nr:hypothetical protein [Patescibacteria group bacterium]